MEISDHFLVALSPSAFTQRASLPSLMNLKRGYSKKRDQEDIATAGYEY